MLRSARFVSLLSVLFFLLATLTTSFAAIHTSAVPQVRVTAKVDITKRATLPGHVPPAVRSAVDLGRIDPSTPAQHLVMVLKSSDAQKREIRRVIDQQQDKRTGNYHQWLTPEEFGQHFGVHDADIAQVSAWLSSQGFTVENVSKSKRVIQFSGTTGNIESAFQTEVHSYKVGSQQHVSISRDITVPAALSPVIAGVPLSNFFRKSHMGPVQRLSQLKQAPNYSACTGSSVSTCTTHYVGPSDFATIYNTAPLLAAGINGTGSSIAIVGRSDILLSDVQSYRQLFNLPINDPIFIHAGQDNGVEPGDDGESDLDVEISGGIAPKAQVYFVIGTPTYMVDGITNSIEYIVENNLADIMSISYGSCESAEGAGGNEFNLQAFEQAAAQGISVFVAAGDNGPAECDDSSDSAEVYGYATGGESSTPYTVSVGGTEFDEGTATSTPYWSLYTDQWHLNSALTYIPERPWNEALAADATSTPSADLSGLWSGSGGISAYYLQPSWQSGPGVPSSDPTLVGGNWVTGINITNGGSGYITAPTVTFSGGGCITEPSAGSATISGGVVTSASATYGAQGFDCPTAPTVTFSAAPAGGTTATGSAIIGPMQNILPLISGVPHRYTPDLALNAAANHDGTLFCSEGVCEISSAGVLLDAGLVGGTSVAAPSMAGIQALINQVNGGRQGAPNYIYYALAAAQNTENCNSITPPAAGSNCAFQDITTGDNLICGAAHTSGRTTTCVAGAMIGFEAGVGYDLTTGLGSVNATNLAIQWGNVTFNSSSTTLGLSQTTAIAQGGSVTFSGTVTAGSGTGTPTGDVAFILSKGAFGQTVDVNTEAWSGPSPFATLDGGGNFTATLSNLPAGNYTVTARYAGDQNFASSLSASVPVNVLTGNSTVTITPQYLNDTTTCALMNTTSFKYGQFAWIPATVTSNTGSGVPTGTVTFTVDSVPYATETLDPNGNGYLAAGAIYDSSCLYDYMFAQSPTLTGGVHSIGASYSGDSTFSPATATPVVITVAPLSVTPTLTAGAQTITSGFAVPFTATFAASSAVTSGLNTGSSGPTGTVTFTDTTTSTVLGTAPVVPSVTFSGSGYQSYTYAATAVFSTTGITTSGANAITATYSGDSNYNGATSSPVTVTVSSGTPTATTTIVTSSANPTTLGGRPTFTATIGVVSGTAPTSGTVTFYDGTTLLGTGTVGSAHTATYRPGTTSAFVGGTHNITAVYGGIVADAPSTSPVFVETVTKGTNIITLTAKTVGLYGQTYTFAAVLTPSSTSAVYTPTLSSVQFFDGATNIGSSPATTVTSSQGGYGLWTAPLTVSNLTPGTHNITAQYSDTNYSLSTSNTQAVFVGGTPTLSWPPPAAITYGTALSATQLNATDNIPGYFVYSPAAGTVLSAGSQLLSVVFTPADSLDFPTQIKTVKLQVLHATPVITWATPAAITYGTALSGTQLDATASFNGNSVPGNFVYNPPAGTVLTVGTHTLSVTFTPTDTLDYATVTQTVSLQVTKATPTVTWANPANITYPTALSGTQLNATASFNGNTLPGSFVYTPPAGTVLNGGNGQTLSVTFTPTDTTDYNSVTQTASINVLQATPTVTWATPAAITYGTLLSGTQLNATASFNGNALLGSFVYTPPAGTLLGAGSQTLNVTFTPTDTTDYTTAIGSVQLHVNQATPVITWPTPSAITYGTALSGTQLDASAACPTPSFVRAARVVRNTVVGGCTSLSGSFVYTPPAATVLGAGSQTLNVTFTPTDTTDYTTATATVTLQVNQATPVIYWPTPSDITYGTALSGTQLDAQACTGGGVGSLLRSVKQVRNSVGCTGTPIPGAFVYTPPAGTVMVGGLGQTLSVVFTPTDTTDYTTANGSVLINVNPASQTITFPNPGAQPYGSLFYPSASASSGLPVSFTSNNLSVCTVSGGNTVTLLTVGGSCSLTATQGGNSNYLAAAPVTQSFTVGKEPQTITFNVIPNQFVGATNVPLTATSNSGLAVTITSQSPSICTVAGLATVAGTGYTANMLAVGNCKLLATQGGNAIYAPAGGGVGHTFAVSLNPQTITFNPISAVTYGVAPFGIDPTTTANGLTVNLASTTPTICTLSSATSPATVTAIGAGLCTIKATQPGDNLYYAAATTVTQSFTVHWETQSITFAAIPNPPLSEGTITVNPTSSVASLQVALTSSTTGVCTVGNYTAGTGYTVNLKAVGNCSLTATQPGTSGISAAAAVGHTFQVTAH